MKTFIVKGRKDWRARTQEQIDEHHKEFKERMIKIWEAIKNENK